jgi:NAD(P)-dependent dehydrogenase (short-subunit alcohol dehydrogenase family)
MTRIAVITGANRGLGFATARRLGQSGVKVIVGARTLAKGEEAADRLRREGFDVEPLHIDVNSVTSVQEAAERVAQQHRRLTSLSTTPGSCRRRRQATSTRSTCAC